MLFNLLCLFFQDRFLKLLSYWPTSSNTWWITWQNLGLEEMCAVPKNLTSSLITNWILRQVLVLDLSFVVCYYIIQIISSRSWLLVLYDAHIIILHHSHRFKNMLIPSVKLGLLYYYIILSTFHFLKLVLIDSKVKI